MDHSIVTQSAFDGLSASDRDLWAGHEGNIVREYCKWPDHYFGAQAYPAIHPYMLEIDGLPFHYPPISHPRYHWRMTQDAQRPHLEWMPEEPNLNWQFMRDGFTHYLSAIQRDIADGRIQNAAKRLGIVLHVCQDTHESHALEGPWGIDLFALDRLMEVPTGDIQLTPSMLLAKGQTHPVDLSARRPILEGDSVGEVALRLYRRYVLAALSNRLLQVPIVQARLNGDEATAQTLLDRIARTCAELSIDLIHTVTALATGRFDPQEQLDLQQLPLDPIWAVQRPWNARGPYRFSAIVANACLDQDCRRHPLQIKTDGAIQTINRGWGSGAHEYMTIAYELPEGVYRRLTTTIALHEPLGRGGCIDFEILHQGQSVTRQRLQKNAPSLIVDLPVMAGGEVRFILRETSESDPRANSLVWAEPTLSKV